MFIAGRFFPKYQKKNVSWIAYFVNLKFSSASRLFCTESRKIQFSISTRKPTAWNLKIALRGESEENKEKWDESFSRARATRKKQGQRAPPPFPTRFSRTGGAPVVVTASVSDLSTLVDVTQGKVSLLKCKRSLVFQWISLFFKAKTLIYSVVAFYFKRFRLVTSVIAFYLKR